MAYKRTRARTRAPSRYRRRRSYRYRRTNTSRPARSYRRRRMTRSRSRKKVPVSKFVLAQLDPFSDKVSGVKIPDANTQPSATAIVEDEWPCTTGASYGTQVFVLRPFATYMQVPSTITGASSWTWPTAFGGGVSSSKRTTIVNNNTLVRTAAYGCRISCALAPNNVTGYIHICLAPVSDRNSVTWSYPLSVSDMQNSPFYKRYPLAVLTQRPLKVVSKILDENAFRYYDPISAVDNSTTDMGLHHSGWAPIMIAVTGAPLNSTAVSVESILHLETLPSVSSAIGTSPAANDSSTQREMATNVANGTPAGRLEGSGSGGYSLSVPRPVSNFLGGIDAYGQQVYQNIGDAAYGWGRTAAEMGTAWFINQYFNNRAVVPYQGR